MKKWKEDNGAFMDRFLKEYLKDNLRIEITCDVNDHKWFYTNVYRLGDETWEQDSYWNLTFDTYENALEAGIKYCMGKLT